MPYSSYPRVPIICALCGSPAMAVRFMVKRGKGRFCTQRCAITSLGKSTGETLAEKFERLIDKSQGPDGCWIWTGPKKRGYGLYTVRLVDEHGNRRTTSIRAHRGVYEALIGPIPAGLTLDHLCRNPSCVNPAHLEPVTQAANNRRGKNVTLKEEDVRHIRKLREQGRVPSEIYTLTGLSRQIVYRVYHNITWRDVI